MFSYLPRSSGIHRADPLVKLLWFLILFIGVFMVRYPSQVVLFFGSTMVAAVLARMRLKELVRTWGVFAVLFLVLYPGFTLLVSWGAVSLEIVARESIMMTARVATAMTGVSVMTATTTPNGMSTAFARLGFPFKVALVLELSFALLPEFLREMRTVVQMQQTRGFKLRFRPLHPVATMRGFLPVLAPMIFLVLHRAWDLSISMETRGFFVKDKPAGVPFKFGFHEALLVSMSIVPVLLPLFRAAPPGVA